MKQLNLFDSIDNDQQDVKKLDESVKNPINQIFIYIVQTETSPHKASPIGLSLSKGKGQNCYIPINHHDTKNIKNALEILKPLFEDKGIVKVGHNVKAIIILLNRFGIKLKGDLQDIQIMSYLIDPNRTSHNLDIIAQNYIQRGIYVNEGIKKMRFDTISVEDVARYACESVDAIRELLPVLKKEISDRGLLKLYQDIEMPLVNILARIESNGIKIDINRLHELSKEMSRMLEELETKIHSLAGQSFNINSPRQLSHILFEVLKLKPVRKTKTGFSTDNDTLSQLSLQHELPAEILNYRSLFKLKGTYLDTLPDYVDKHTGRIHTTLNQTVTATGRLSSSDPNLQNIPIRGEWGSKIRAAFIAEKGFKIISADYSQIELRILAHLSNDEHLIEAFLRDTDIHTSTASLLFKVDKSDVSKEMRRIAKTVNFGVIYGMSPYGLSEALRISTSEAGEYISNYFTLYKGVKDFIDKTIQDARQDGFVTTLFGRKRPIPEINSTNTNTRQQAERMAVNTPIQGSAADLIKIAMIKMDDTLTKHSYKTRMILQIHDELLFEAPEDEVKEMIPLIKKTMETVADLKVPLKVDINHGDSWGDAH
ncbi:MAG: DNA polymerase I [Thermodesulfovibrionales bacterium]|nr:DNA polymerase I [Thermodesulfovibrionales bacterium]